MFSTYAIYNCVMRQRWSCILSTRTPTAHRWGSSEPVLVLNQSIYPNQVSLGPVFSQASATVKWYSSDERSLAICVANSASCLSLMRSCRRSPFIWHQPRGSMFRLGLLTTRSHSVLKIDPLSNKRIGVSNCEASALVRHTQYRASRC
jgi:hypothetical protein